MENLIKITVEDDMKGSRIDAALAGIVQNLSRSALQKLIEQGGVSVNGQICTEKKRKVEAGDLVEVLVPEPVELDVAAENIPLDIVYEDDDVLVVNKPKGMVVHPAAGNYTGTLVNAVMYHCKGRLSSINGVIRPGIVNRIDKDTSGLLMIAKNDEAHKSLAAQLEKHTIKRSYQAIVYNNFTEDEGTVDAPIGRDPSNRLRQAVTYSNSKEAYTTYRGLERLGRFTLIEAVLKTGRTHQIRVHMAYIKHPLLGDTVYGPKKPLYGAQGQMLHAKTLGFVHPSTGEYMEFDSELPEEFQTILEKLRRDR